MKLKTTKKQIRENSYKILKFGYCEIQALTNYIRPFAYSAGYNGWSCDYYTIDGVTISTGYNPIGEYTDYKTVKKYEQKAEKINANFDYKFETKRKKLNNLLIKMIKELAEA